MGRRGGGPPGLRALVQAWLEDDSFHAPGSPHNSVADAQACMLLYRLVASQWEEYVKKKWEAVPQEMLETRGSRVRVRRQVKDDKSGGCTRAASELRHRLRRLHSIHHLRCMQRAFRRRSVLK